MDVKVVFMGNSNPNKAEEIRVIFPACKGMTIEGRTHGTTGSMVALFDENHQEIGRWQYDWLLDGLNYWRCMAKDLAKAINIRLKSAEKPAVIDWYNLFSITEEIRAKCESRCGSQLRGNYEIRASFV